MVFNFNSIKNRTFLNSYKSVEDLIQILIQINIINRINFENIFPEMSSFKKLIPLLNRVVIRKI